MEPTIADVLRAITLLREEIDHRLIAVNDRMTGVNDRITGVNDPLTGVERILHGLDRDVAALVRVAHTHDNDDRGSTVREQSFHGSQ